MIILVGASGGSHRGPYIRDQKIEIIITKSLMFLSIMGIRDYFYFDRSILIAYPKCRDSTSGSRGGISQTFLT